MERHHPFLLLTALVGCLAGTCSLTTAHATGDVEFVAEAAAPSTTFTDENLQPCAAYNNCNSSCECNERLLGLFRHSDHCYDRFISPMTNPVFFEDPRTLTEARTIFLQHNVPAAAGGGDVRLIAVQLRAALTERLSIVASKDGFIMSNNDIIDDGWADLALGLKYNLYADPCTQRLLSAGFHYELPVGSPSALQGNGDGEFHTYLTGGTQIRDYAHWISASGLRLPADRGQESSMFYWSNHFDVEVVNGWYALAETNWYNWFDSGNNTALAGIEGGDLFNFGSVGVTGNNIVTQALGFKYKCEIAIVNWALRLNFRSAIARTSWKIV